MRRDEYISVMCRRISERVAREANRMLKGTGITRAQSRALSCIIKAPGVVSQKDVEDFLEISHSAVVGVISRMEANKLVYCVQDKNDLRQKLIFPTDHGREVYEKSRKDLADLEKELTAEFSNEEADQLRTLLNKYIAALIRRGDGTSLLSGSEVSHVTEGSDNSTCE